MKSRGLLKRFVTSQQSFGFVSEIYFGAELFELQSCDIRAIAVMYDE